MYNNEEELDCKVVLLGASGVGKTSIITQYLEHKFFENKTKSTVGAEFFPKVVQVDNNKKVRLNIWDTVGQEKYKSLTMMFYKDAQAAILVYDVTCQESFNELVDYWALQINESAPKGVQIIIAGNKIDLEKVVKDDKAVQLSEKMGGEFVLISAMKRIGIDDLFKTIANNYINPDWINTMKEDKASRRKDSKNLYESSSSSMESYLKKKKSCCKF